MNFEGPVYSCSNCEYTGCNRQELAQHLAVAHKRKVFKCHLCPFISCYKNSFDRHKKLVHKFIACEVCGTHCESEQGLLQHTREAHSDLLSIHESPKRRGRTEIPAEPAEQTFDLTEQANALYLSQFGNHYGNQVEEPTVSFEGYEQDYQDIYHQNLQEFEQTQQGNQQESQGYPQEQPSETNMDLMPQKFKRSYPCKDCEYRTFSPRDYLYHRRHDHDDNNAIHECRLCVYATKHLQKLDRHNQLVHKISLSEMHLVKKMKAKPATVSVDSVIEQVSSVPSIDWKVQEPIAEPLPGKSPKNKFLCTKCDFQSKSKFLLAQHEKTVHLRKKFFRCLKCGFVTNERGRYNKHVKYHNLPAQMCSHCSFSTPYKWNLDRHMKNHELLKGKYSCNKCNFKTNSSQSFKTHTEQHHAKLDHSEESIPVEDNRTDVEDDTEVSNNEEDEDVEDNDGIQWKIEEDASEDEAPILNGNQSEQNLKLFRSISPVPDINDTEDTTQKYPCPLCGENFNSLAWLARHLSQKHAQSPNVKKLVKAVQNLSPQTHEQPTVTISKLANSAQNPNNKSNNRIISKSSVKRTKSENSVLTQSKNLIPHTDEQSENNIVFKKSKKVTIGIIKPSFPTHVCRVCMYKNTIMAEMEKHVLSHCTDKPFSCRLCKFRCRWKGDMKKHILKAHDPSAVAAFEQAPNPLLKYMYTESTPSNTNDDDIDEDQKIEFKDDEEEFSSEPDSETEHEQEFKKPKSNADLAPRLNVRPKALLTTKSRTINPPARSKNEGYWQNPRINPMTKNTSQQGKPLDMASFHDEFPTKGKLDTLLRMEPVKLPRVQMKSSALFAKEESEMHTKSNASVGQGVKRQVETDCFEEAQKEDNLYRYLEAQQNYFYGGVEDNTLISPHKKKQKITDDAQSCILLTDKKYKCSYCPFMSRTASRFHVHIVQHLNKKPFMCSICSYRSNWEWDITKHIKIKSVRDEAHLNAQTVITDETGRKNYEKYNKYLIEEAAHRPSASATSNTNISTPDDDNLEQILSPEDLVETILVTPDLEDMEKDLPLQHPEQPVSGMVFRCGHCLFKHPEKKAVIGHLGIHSGSKPYKCKICGIVSSWRHVILRHVKSMHGCDVEAIEDRLQYTINDNIILIAGDTDNNEQTISTTIFQCHLCPYTSDYNHHMQMHLRQHMPREGANIKCPKCPYWVKYRKTLSSHMRFHPSNMDNEPENPPHALPPTLTREVNEYPESPVEQYHDGYSDSLPNNEEPQWDISMTQHEQHEKKHFCEMCPFKTDNKSHFMYHKQFHRPNKNAPFKCTHCTYWSGFKNIMNKHIRTHDESTLYRGIPTSDLHSAIVDVEGRPKKMFQCRFCPMMNKRRANVVSHEAQHSKGKTMKFLCGLCTYQSNSQGVMTSHMRLHGNENVSIAEVLSESLKYPPENKPSVQIYPPELPIKQTSVTPGKKYFTYICKRCPAVFKSKSDYLTHSSFHGSSLPMKCPHCDYRARRKLHLQRHIVVHTPNYMEKRERSIKDTSPQENGSSALSLLLTTPESPTKISPEVTDIDDAAALEREMENLQIYFRNKGTGKNNQKKYRCKMCPMAFNHTPDLMFHRALHRSQGCHKCPKCSYGTNNQDLRNYHTKLHTKSIHGFGSPPVEESPSISLVSTATVFNAAIAPKNGTNSTPKSGLKTWPCPLCPAVFLKQQRYDKHITLHGANNKLTCPECNYSVCYLANLNKHKKVHIPGYKPYGVKDKQEINEAENVHSALSTASPEFTVPTSPIKKVAGKFQTKEVKEKHVFVCGNCPYTSTRKDNISNHLHKHSPPTGQVYCPYCDYVTFGASLLKDHLKWHFQQRPFMKVKAYMKYDQLEIWSFNGSRDLIFKDHGDGKSDRFFPEDLKEEQEIDNSESTPDEGLEQENKPITEASKKPINENIKQEGSLELDETILIQDALQERKKMEVVLTDVFSKNEAVEDENASESNNKEGLKLHCRTLSNDPKELTKLEPNKQDTNVGDVMDCDPVINISEHCGKETAAFNIDSRSDGTNMDDKVVVDDPLSSSPMDQSCVISSENKTDKCVSDNFASPKNISFKDVPKMVGNDESSNKGETGPADIIYAVSTKEENTASTDLKDCYNNLDVHTTADKDVLNEIGISVCEVPALQIPEYSAKARDGVVSEEDNDLIGSEVLEEILIELDSRDKVNLKHND